MLRPMYVLEQTLIRSDWRLQQHASTTVKQLSKCGALRDALNRVHHSSARCQSQTLRLLSSRARPPTAA
jgi:hypothetical protein